MSEKLKVLRGEVYYIRLEKGVEGSEQTGVRPGIILQNDIGNHFSTTTIVACITTKKELQNKKHKLPVHVKLEAGNYGLEFDSYVMLEQLRTISKSRLIDRVGKLNKRDMERVEKAMLISLGALKT